LKQYILEDIQKDPAPKSAHNELNCS